MLSVAELASEDEAAEELESTAELDTAEELASVVEEEATEEVTVLVGRRPLRLTILPPGKQGIAKVLVPIRTETEREAQSSRPLLPSWLPLP